MFARDAEAEHLPGRPQVIARALAALAPEEAALVRQLLAEDPASRPTMQAVLKDPLVALGHVTLVRTANAEKAKAGDMADMADVIVGAVKEAAADVGKQVQDLNRD